MNHFPFSKYTVLRKTIHLNIPYYVKDRFETEYQGSLARLENAVEEEYIAVMKQSCYRERSYRKLTYRMLLPEHKPTPSFAWFSSSISIR